MFKQNKATTTTTRGPVQQKLREKMRKQNFQRKRTTTCDLSTMKQDPLPIGTWEPVIKWQSWRLRRLMGRCPNISGSGRLEEDSGPTIFEPAPSPMSMSRTYQETGLSCIGEVGCDWMTANRSIPLPKPYDVAERVSERVSERARLFRRVASNTLGDPAKVDWRPQMDSFCLSEIQFVLSLLVFFYFVYVRQDFCTKKCKPKFFQPLTASSKSQKWKTKSEKKRKQNPEKLIMKAMHHFEK